MSMSRDYDETSESRELEIYSGPVSVISQEIDVQIATSKRFPRRKDLVISSAIMSRATLNGDIAAECIYNLPRDGKAITGPSIRFAEIVRSCYGNIRVASRFVRIDAEDKMRQAVICEAVAYDTELNDTECSQVRRSIMTSAKGNNIPRAYTADMIATTIMAAQAIARRNAILALVPKAVWIDGMAQVERVVKGDAATLNERRAKMLEGFARFGVGPKELFAALGVDSEHEIGLNDMPTLAGAWSALKDGEAAESVLGLLAGNRQPTKPAVENPMANKPMRGNSQADAAEEHIPGVKDRDGSGETVGDQRADATKRKPGRPAGSGKKPATDTPTPATASPPAAEPDARELSDIADSGDEPETRDREAEAAQEQREARPQADPADPGDIPPSLDRRGEKKTAPAKQSPYDEMLEYIGKFAGSAGQLMDWWRGKREERKALSFDEQGDISKAYNGKFSELQNE